MEIDISAHAVELVFVSVFLLAYVCWKLSSRDGKLHPPVEGGWVPWLGCAVAFGKEPLWYIKKTHEKVGMTCI